MQLGFTDAIACAEQELSVEMVCAPEEVLEAKRLRYRIYCEERGFEPGEGGLEQDAFDDFSRHVLVRSRNTGAVHGTVRVALCPEKNSRLGFPMERVCKSSVTARLPRQATGEVSRFALSRDRSGISPAAAALMRVCLIRGVIGVAHHEGLTHLCALMERTLLRLLQATSIHFLPIGPEIEYRGLRHPSLWEVDEGLDRVQRENPVLWSFITNQGAFAPPRTDTAHLGAGGRQQQAAVRRLH